MKQILLVINSDQEYYELLKQLNEDNNDIVETDIDPAEFGQNPIEFESKNPMMLRASYAKGVRYTSKTASKWLGSVPGAPPVKINMCFDYTVKKVKGKWVFKTILKDKRKAWLTGVQFPIAYIWKTISHNYTPNSTRTKVKFTLKGVAGTTVIYKGLPTLLRTNLTYKFSYNITNAREQEIYMDNKTLVSISYFFLLILSIVILYFIYKGIKYILKKCHNKK